MNTSNTPVVRTKRYLINTRRKEPTKAEKREAKRLRQLQAVESVPRSLIYPKGIVGSSVKKLIEGLKHVMMPYTASRTRVVSGTRMKDVVDYAKQVHITHLLILTNPTTGAHIRFVRVPSGPSIFCKIISFCTEADLINFGKETGLKFQTFNDKMYTPPLVILNGFKSDQVHVKLASVMFNNMFPPLDVDNFDAKECKRVVLFNYDKETDIIDMRSYAISLEKIITEKSVVNKVDLVETGPRLRFTIIKIIDGVETGDTLYHKYIKMTPQEIAEKKLERERKMQEKEYRRKIQEENVARKKRAKEEKEALEKLKQEEMKDRALKEIQKYIDQEDSEEEDDAKYFRKAVGEDPTPEMNLGSNKKVEQNTPKKGKKKAPKKGKKNADNKRKRESDNSNKPKKKRK